MKTISKLFIIICILVLLIVAGYYLWQNSNEKPVWQTYQNARYSFSVDYPPGWSLGEAPTNNDGREFTSSEQEINCRAYGFYNALIDDEGNPQDLTEFVAWIKNDDMKIIEENNTTLGDNSAYKIVYQETGSTNVTAAIYTIGLESGRALTCTFPSFIILSDFQESFDKMHQSYKIAVSLDGEEIADDTQCQNLLGGVITPLEDMQTLEDENYPEVANLDEESWDNEQLPTEVKDWREQGYDCNPSAVEFGEDVGTPGMHVQPEVTKVQWLCELEYEDWHYLKANAEEELNNWQEQGYGCESHGCYEEDGEHTFVWFCFK